VYRLNDDVRGVFFITEYSQLIVVAYSLSAINRIEKELRMGIRMGLNLCAKYEFKDSVFYEFIQSDFPDFSEFVEYLNESEPED
jgi:hypothetical protein